MALPPRTVCGFRSAASWLRNRGFNPIRTVSFYFYWFYLEPPPKCTHEDPIVSFPFHEPEPAHWREGAGFLEPACYLNLGQAGTGAPVFQMRTDQA